jgi:CelD/BcsL family acetyltransferase involved in cellulose biosynthesis
VIRSELLQDPGALEPYRDAWDSLADEAAEPYCASAWLLAWWHEAAPRRARLRVAVATEAGRLLGVAPFYADQRLRAVEWLKPLAASVSHRVQPLAARGRHAEVAAALAGALARARPTPRLVSLEGIPRDSLWPQLLADSWPGRRPRIHHRGSGAAPELRLHGRDYAGWLAGQSPNFRQQVRRMRRRLEGRGARFRRVAAGDDLATAVRALVTLHHARWAERGGSAAVDPHVERMLLAAAESMADAERLWLWAIEADGRIVSAYLFVRAGDRVAYWLGGHDDDWGACQPGMQALLAAVEDAFDRGLSTLDLGPGVQAYKGRLTNETVALDSASLAVAGAAYPLARATLAAVDVRRAAMPRLRAARRRLR